MENRQPNPYSQNKTTILITLAALVVIVATIIIVRVTCPTAVTNTENETTIPQTQLDSNPNTTTFYHGTSDQNDDNYYEGKYTSLYDYLERSYFTYGEEYIKRGYWNGGEYSNKLFSISVPQGYEIITAGRDITYFIKGDYYIKLLGVVTITGGGFGFDNEQRCPTLEDSPITKIRENSKDIPFDIYRRDTLVSKNSTEFQTHDIFNKSCAIAYVDNTSSCEKYWYGSEISNDQTGAVINIGDFITEQEAMDNDLISTAISISYWYFPYMYNEGAICQNDSALKAQLAEFDSIIKTIKIEKQSILDYNKSED